MSLRRSGIHSLHNNRDLVGGQRTVVRARLDADGGVDVPGRHVPADHALFDGSSPLADVLICTERHRRGRTSAVARSHFAWKIGATSLANVTAEDVSAAITAIPTIRSMNFSLTLVLWQRGFR